MKMSEAMKIIEYTPPKGFMVSFEKVKLGILESGHFPDNMAGEPLITTEEAAWKLARQFAEKTWGRYVNIYVIDAEYRPVPGYKQRMIVNR